MSRLSLPIDLKTFQIRLFCRRDFVIMIPDVDVASTHCFNLQIDPRPYLFQFLTGYSALLLNSFVTHTLAVTHPFLTVIVGVRSPGDKCLLHLTWCFQGYLRSSWVVYDFSPLLIIELFIVKITVIVTECFSQTVFCSPLIKCVVRCLS